MKKFLFPLAVVMILSSVSCSSPYKYFGKNYPATENPELFFRAEDVPRAYEEMGKLEVELPESHKLEKIQKKVIAIAAKHGADAVMIDNFDMTTGGFTTVSSSGGGRNKDGGNYNVGAKTTRVEKDVLVKATLLKFKDNIHRE